MIPQILRQNKEKATTSKLQNIPNIKNTIFLLLKQRKNSLTCIKKVQKGEASKAISMWGICLNSKKKPSLTTISAGP